MKDARYRLNPKSRNRSATIKILKGDAGIGSRKAVFIPAFAY